MWYFHVENKKRCDKNLTKMHSFHFKLYQLPQFILFTDLESKALDNFCENCSRFLKVFQTLHTTCGFRIKYTTTQNLFCMETDSLHNRVMTTDLSSSKATQSTRSHACFLLRLSGLHPFNLLQLEIIYSHSFGNGNK